MQEVARGQPNGLAAFDNGADDVGSQDRQKRLLSLRLAVSEASMHWGSVLEGLQAPKLVISDGHKGLTKALEKWPGCRLQRCTEHKRANLLEHCPAHARRELRRDYNRIVYAKNGIDARKAYDELVTKWMPWCTTPIEAESSLGPDSHHPIISLSGIPSAVMVFRILHPILASTLCAANPLARIAEPTIAL